METLTVDVLVVGGGAIGLSVGVRLAQAGASVCLVGPDPTASASRVAAGMIAPLTETWTDPATSGALPLFTAAAALWPMFAAETGVRFRRTGALWIPPPGGQPPRSVDPSRYALVDLSQARAMSPLLETVDGPMFHAPEEGCVDAGQALAALGETFAALGGVRRVGEARSVGAIWRVGAMEIRAGKVVLASGMSAVSLSDLAPETRILTPVRGQILRLETCIDPMSPSLRGPGAYVAPQSDGSVRVGATMEAGETSLAPDPDTTARLLAAASRFAPSLEGIAVTAEVGIRAATPDALPLVGPSSRAGVFLATGLRRNGWLLAPLVAEVIAAYLADKDPGRYAGELRPGRFGAGRDDA